MQIARRSWLLLTLLGSGVVSQAQTPLAITSGPYLQNPSGRAMTIMWITNGNSTGVVEYGRPDEPLKTAVHTRDGLLDANQRVHKVVLNGLEPGKTYRYRAVSREIVTFGPNKVTFGATVDSGFKEFRTFDPSKPDISFLVLNDMHDNPASFADLIKAAGSRPFDFVALNGDTVSYIDSEARITAMLDGAVPLFASRIPLFWVRGNHETRGSFARQFPHYLDTPGGRYFYSFDQGPAHFIVLDAGEDKMDSHAEYSGLVDFASYRAEEAAWLKAETATEAFRKAKYRIVLVHMPFAAAASQNRPGPFTGMKDAYREFGGILEKAGIDMMISAHVHRAAIVEAEPGQHSYPIVVGGGPKDPSRTVIRVDVTGRGIEAVILRPDGTTFGTCRVAAKR